MAIPMFRVMPIEIKNIAKNKFLIGFIKCSIWSDSPDSATSIPAKKPPRATENPDFSTKSDTPKQIPMVRTTNKLLSLKLTAFLMTFGMKNIPMAKIKVRTDSNFMPVGKITFASRTVLKSIAPNRVSMIMATMS